jgi:hypothetical protein
MRGMIAAEGRIGTEGITAGEAAAALRALFDPTPLQRAR